MSPLKVEGIVNITMNDIAFAIFITMKAIQENGKNAKNAGIYLVKMILKMLSMILTMYHDISLHSRPKNRIKKLG